MMQSQNLYKSSSKQTIQTICILIHMISFNFVLIIKKSDALHEHILHKIGVLFGLNSKKVFNNLLIYRTSGADIKSVTISINKEGCNDISYAPFALFGGSTFSTGTIGKIDNTLKTGNVTIKCNDNGSIQNVKFSNFSQYVNAVIIIYYENIKNAIVKEE